MIGTFPINHTLTPRQQQISAQISQALSDMPTTLSDLISEMATPDFSIATLELELDDQGKIIPNEHNQRIVDHIELALTSPSDECHPAYKAQIFVTASEPKKSTRIVRPYLFEIIDRLHKDGRRINLDDVELVNLVIDHRKQCDLTGISAKRASFLSIRMSGVTLNDADLTGATFTDTAMSYSTLNQADISGAVFSNSSFFMVGCAVLTGNQHGIKKCQLWKGGVCDVDLDLTGEGITAKPDMEKFTLPANKTFSFFD